MLRIGFGAFLLAVLLGVLWLARGRALALSLALAFPAAEGWLPGADVVREEVQIPFAGRMVAADLYRSGRPRGVVLLVHGLSAAGRRQPDLARPAIVAALDHAAGRWKLLQLLAGLVDDAHDRAGLDVIARAKLASPFEDTSRRESALRAEGRAVLALVHNRRADAVGGLLAGLSSDTHAALDRLSPLSVMSRLRGRALIAHGRADPSIPYTESVRLAEAAGTQAIILTAFHHTGPLSLAEIMRFGVPDGWKLVSLTEALLSARSR